MCEGGVSFFVFCDDDDDDVDEQLMLWSFADRTEGWQSQSFCLPTHTFSFILFDEKRSWLFFCA